VQTVLRTQNTNSSGLVSYSQFSLQSVNFSISLSELLLDLHNPSIHLCLKT